MFEQRTRARIYNHEREMTPRRRTRRMVAQGRSLRGRGTTKRRIYDHQKASPSATATSVTSIRKSPDRRSSDISARSVSREFAEYKGSKSRRRHVTITGRPSEMTRHRVAQQRSSTRSFNQRLSSRPDRFVGWAFGLGLFLAAISVSTANACPL